MNDPLLTIAIPTYNRLRFLRHTLQVVFPQLTDDVELYVSDNCSTDGTWEYLQSQGDKIRSFRQMTNIGAQRNIISCLRSARGRYVWTLSDDDMPAENAVPSIRTAIQMFEDPPLLFLRSSWHKPHNLRTAFSVKKDWRLFDKNRFVRSIGQFFSVCSGLVVRRDCVDYDFIGRFVDKDIVPAAIALSVAGHHNKIVMPDENVLACRSGNSGGYDGLTTLSRNIKELLTACAKFGYRRETLDWAYNEYLGGVIGYAIVYMPITIKGICDLTASSWTYRRFYSHAFPRLVSKLLDNIIINGRIAFYQWFLKMQNQAAMDLFKRTVAVGVDCRIQHPFYIKGGKYIHIGHNFGAGPELRMEAFDRYHKHVYTPAIYIGDDVSFNYNVHIGAIQQVIIGDHVLVGSHVLITDHCHGDMANRNSCDLIKQAPLTSKGEVVIDDNVWIGEGVCILPGVHIGKGAVIGANAVVTHNVPAGCVAGGIPARVLSKGGRE